MKNCKLCSCIITGGTYKASLGREVIDNLCCKCAGNLNLFKNDNATENTLAWANQIIQSNTTDEKMKQSLKKLSEQCEIKPQKVTTVKRIDDEKEETPNTPFSNNDKKSSKSRVTAALLCFFLGFLGIHRFYVGKIGTGLLWMFTGGIFGIGTLVDFIVILCGGFKDSEELKL